MAAVVCPVCRHADPVPKWEIRGYRIGECRACGHRFVAQQVPETVLTAAYAEDYYGGGDAGGYENYLGKLDSRMAAFRERLASLERYVRPPGSVLDVGCAVGLFLRVAQERGWTAIGVERSAWAAEYGRRTWGLNILLDMREASRPPGYDAVTMWDVVEHLEHPHRVLEQAHSLLRDGGYLALSTVNSSSLGARRAGRDWRHLVPPLHLQYFTKASLFGLLRRAGFRPIAHYPDGVCLGAGVPATPLRGVKGRFEALVMHWRLQGLTRLLNLRDEIGVIAQKVSATREH